VAIQASVQVLRHQLTTFQSFLADEL
jgi:hypothetical protein